MKTKSDTAAGAGQLVIHRISRAFTLTELLVIIAIIIIALLAIDTRILPLRPASKRVTCLNNLHQISKGFKTWVLDGALYPVDYRPEAKGPPGGDPTISAMCADGRGEAAAQLLYQVFMVMSNELRTPKVLYCPAEYAVSHSNATTFAATTTTGCRETPFGKRASANYQVSYFLNGKANDAYPQTFMAGDHAMGDVPGSDWRVPIAAARAYGAGGGSAGCFISGGTGAGGVSTNKPTAAWMNNSQHKMCGNIVLDDGSAETMTISKLRDSLAHTGDYHNNQFLFPPTD